MLIENIVLKFIHQYDCFKTDPSKVGGQLPPLPPLLLPLCHTLSLRQVGSRAKLLTSNLLWTRWARFRSPMKSTKVLNPRRNCMPTTLPPNLCFTCHYRLAGMTQWVHGCFSTIHPLAMFYYAAFSYVVVLHTIDKGKEGLETEILSALWVTSLWRIGAMQAGAHATVTLCICSLHKKCLRDFRFGEQR